MLVVAPISGHFATLLRGTAQTLLADHDVYITDWHNAHDIGLLYGEAASTSLSITSSPFSRCLARHACRHC